ncbi:hypothetical protein GDO86_016859, partial [Hymenochirus boettgeri]
KDTFIIESGNLTKCISVESSRIVLRDCSVHSKNMLWKWVSHNALFNIGNSRCLGLNLSNVQEPLGMFECDSALHTLWWKCSKDLLIGADRYILAVERGTVVARRNLDYKWRRYRSPDESFCVEHQFQEIYTLRGNSAGKPCTFPFKYNNTWHHECIEDGSKGGTYWCATTMLYDRDGQWGKCPSSDVDTFCQFRWKENKTLQTCYQFNFDSALTWYEARVSCQAQGGDLLSIERVEEMNYLSMIQKSLDKVPFWTGLNSMEEASGWSWSDGSPLALINWKSNLKSNYEGQHCGVSDGGGKWHSSPCTVTLPYACKKYMAPRAAETFDMWRYHPTHCELGWYPHNRFCFKVVKEWLSWKEASDVCYFNGSDLVSVTSLADVEFLLKLLKNENVNETWTGMRVQYWDPVLFQWSDGSAVTFTYWGKEEPVIQNNPSDLCVSVQSTDGTWKLRRCAEKMFSICKRSGQIKPEPVDSETCQKEWERHGEYCYRIDYTNRTFQEASSGYYCASPLATVTNRFEQAFITSLITNKTSARDVYVWIALQDQNNTGEYAWIQNSSKRQNVAFTNWNKHQPSCQGGCVAMQHGKSEGRWEVKDCRTFKAMSLCKKPLMAVMERASVDAYIGVSSECYTWESELHLKYCYKIFHHEKVLRKRTWQEAEDFCQRFGGHLASFSHVDEEKFLMQMLNNMFSRDDERQFWIGFNKRKPSSGGSWGWSDGTPVLSSFLDDMYNDDSRNCAEYRADNKLVRSYCDERLEWICKVGKDKIPDTPDWHMKDIPWVFFQGNDYLLLPGMSQFAPHEFACSWMGGHVLTIHSAAEQAFIEAKIKKFVKSKEKWWIGISEEEPHRWVDGSPVIYNNWEKKADRIVSPNGPMCAYVSAETGLWGYSECSEHHPSICKTSNINKVEREEFHHLKSEAEGSCPIGWLRDFHKCYYVHNSEDGGTLYDWFSAATFCKEHGGRLASIENEIEQAFIVMQLYGQTNSFWIAHRSDDYRDWKSTTSYTYSNWSPILAHQGNMNVTRLSSGDQEDHCALLASNHTFHFPGSWFLERCKNKGYGFICEKALDHFSNNVNGSAINPVPDVLEYGLNLYKLLSGNMSWFDASVKCQEQGGDLVSITDQYYQAFITIVVNRLGYSHWIGLFSPENGHSYEWTDGSRSLFTAWNDEEFPSNGKCSYVGINGRWRTGDCNKELPGAVCLLANNKSTEIADSGECSENWVKFQNYCYSFSSVLKVKDFPSASEVCNHQGSSILTIRDEEENGFILVQLGKFTSVNLIWLDKIVLNGSNTAVWLDGTLVRFSKLVSDPLTSDQCVTLWTNDGTWWTAQCSEQRGFICKKPKEYKETENNPSVSRIVLSLPLFSYFGH